jgi:hypothetical protein
VDRQPLIDSQSSEGQAPDSRALRGELELQHVVSGRCCCCCCCCAGV